MVDFDRLLNRPAMRVFGSREPVGYLRLTAEEGAEPWTIPAVFDRRHVEVNFGDDGNPITALRTILFVRLADMPDGEPPEQGDTITRGADTWQVMDPQPDAIGAFRLILGAHDGDE